MKRLLAAIVTLALSAPVMAADWYVTGAFGGSSTEPKTNLNDRLTSTGATAISSENEAAPATLELGGGVRLSRNIAIEAGYKDFGELENFAAGFTSGANNGQHFSKWDISTLHASLIGSVHVQRNLSLLAVGRIYRMTGKFSTETTLFDPITRAVVSRTGDTTKANATVPAIGFGVAYDLSPQLQLRAIYEQWKPKAGMFGAGNDLDRVRSWSIGAAFTL